PTISCSPPRATRARASRSAAPSTPSTAASRSSSDPGSSRWCRVTSGFPREVSSSTTSCGAWPPTCSRPRRCSSCWASSGLTEDPLVLDVERLTFGFDALAHHGRQVVFVPYAAPADRVQAEVVERRGGYLRARIAAVLVP